MRQELINDLTENYKNKSAKYFVEKYGVTLNAIYSLVNKLELTHNKTWREQKDSIIADYENGMVLSELGDRYGHSEMTIKKYLKQWGVDIRKNHYWASKYEIDLNFFKKIESPEQAYWLGFIYADGNIYSKGVNKTGVLQIALSKKDEYHLEKFKKCIKSGHPIYKDRENKRIMISKNEIYQDLLKLGVSERKSLKLVFPNGDIIPDYLESHFIRGYFDGDGCIFFKNKKWSFSMMGTYPFLSKIQDILESKIGFTKNKLSQEQRNDHGLVYSMQFAGCLNNNRIKNLYDYLYMDINHCIFLDRKKEKFELIMKEYNLC